MGAVATWKGRYGRLATGFVWGTVNGLTGGDRCRRLGKTRRRWWGANFFTEWAEETNGERKERVDDSKKGRDMAKVFFSYHLRALPRHSWENFLSAEHRRPAGGIKPRGARVHDSEFKFLALCNGSINGST